jgi:hypothetical protein
MPYVATTSNECALLADVQAALEINRQPIFKVLLSYGRDPHDQKWFALQIPETCSFGPSAVGPLLGLSHVANFRETQHVGLQMRC